MTFLERTMHLLCMASMEQIDFHDASFLYAFSSSIFTSSKNSIKNFCYQILDYFFIGNNFTLIKIKVN